LGTPSLLLRHHAVPYFPAERLDRFSVNQPSFSFAPANLNAIALLLRKAQPIRSLGKLQGALSAFSASALEERPGAEKIEQCA
jgi:hypothetical protein